MAENVKLKELVSEEDMAAKSKITRISKGRKHIRYLQKMKEKGEKIVQVCPVGFDSFFTMAAEMVDVDVCRLASQTTTHAFVYENNRTHSDNALFTVRSHREKAPHIHINYFMEPTHYSTKENAIRWGSDLIMAGADTLMAMGISNEMVKWMSDNYIPTFCHVGIISGWQTAYEGVYHKVGRTAEEAMAVYRWAYEYQENGMGAITIEMTPHEVSEAIAKKLRIPVISIAGSAACDGSEMVDMDMFGMNPKMASHGKSYGNLMEFLCGVYGAWVNDVRTGAYPEDKHCWFMDPEELEKFNDQFSKI